MIVLFTVCSSIWSKPTITWGPYRPWNVDGGAEWQEKSLAEKNATASNASAGTVYRLFYLGLADPGKTDADTYDPETGTTELGGTLLGEITYSGIGTSVQTLNRFPDATKPEWNTVNGWYLITMYDETSSSFDSILWHADGFDGDNNAKIYLTTGTVKAPDVHNQDWSLTTSEPLITTETDGTTTWPQGNLGLDSQVIPEPFLLVTMLVGLSIFSLRRKNHDHS